MRLLINYGLTVLLCLTAALAIAALDFRGPSSASLAPPEAAALAKLRVSAKSWLSALSDPRKPADLTLLDSDVLTGVRIWNASGRGIKLHLQEDSHVPSGKAYWHLCARSNCPWLSAQLTLSDENGSISPQVSIRGIPIPTVLWRLALKQISSIQSAVDPGFALAQDIKTPIREKAGWRFRVAEPDALKTQVSAVIAAITKGDKTDNLDIEIAHYVALLKGLGAQPAPQDFEFKELLQAVFAEAKRRSNLKTAERENQAAAAALTLTLAPPRLARIAFGKDRQPGWTLLPGNTASRGLAPPLWSRTALNSRKDWSLHFAGSAALEEVSTTKDTAFTGLLKEISDAAPKGSGFDTGDLVANAQGQTLIRLTQRLSGDAALTLQSCLIERPETLLGGPDTIPRVIMSTLDDVVGKAATDQIALEPRLASLRQYLRNRVEMCIAERQLIAAKNR